MNVAQNPRTTGSQTLQKKKHMVQNGTHSSNPAICSSSNSNVDDSGKAILWQSSWLCPHYWYGWYQIAIILLKNLLRKHECVPIWSHSESGKCKQYYSVNKSHHWKLYRWRNYVWKKIRKISPKKIQDWEEQILPIFFLLSIHIRNRSARCNIIKGHLLSLDVRTTTTTKYFV